MFGFQCNRNLLDFYTKCHRSNGEYIKCEVVEHWSNFKLKICFQIFNEVEIYIPRLWMPWWENSAKLTELLIVTLWIWSTCKA